MEQSLRGPAVVGMAGERAGYWAGRQCPRIAPASTPHASVPTRAEPGKRGAEGPRTVLFGASHDVGSYVYSHLTRKLTLSPPIPEKKSIPMSQTPY